MAVENIEITKFDPGHPFLSPDPGQRLFRVKSVGVFAVLEPRHDFFVAVYQISGGWSIPAGRVEGTDKDPIMAAVREFEEETNGVLMADSFTHMGVVSRGVIETSPVGSLIFRARVSGYNFGITHSLDEGEPIRIGGDQEAKIITFLKVGGGLPSPIYRPDINLPVVEAFSRIKD